MNYFLVSVRDDDCGHIVVGVYSTRELADEAARRVASELEVDEVEVDWMPALADGLYAWTVEFERDTIVNVHRSDIRTWEGPKAWVNPGSPDGAGTLYGNPVEPKSVIWCTASDEEHARIVATELRPAAFAEFERLKECGRSSLQFPIPQPCQSNPSTI